MLVIVKINQLCIWAMLDSGCTTNALHEETAVSLGLLVEPALNPAYGVSVNGDETLIKGVCRNLAFDKEGATFYADFLVVPLPDIAQMILGVSWLRELGAITWDFRKHCMTFKFEDQDIRWLGYEINCRNTSDKFAGKTYSRRTPKKGLEGSEARANRRANQSMVKGLMETLVQINGASISALLDSGCTNNILSEDTARRLGLIIEPVPTLQALVPSGQSIPIIGVCREVPFHKDGITFRATFFVIASSLIQMILGVEWLQECGCIQWDFEKVSMTFKFEDRHIKWLGYLNDYLKQK